MSVLLIVIGIVIFLIWSYRQTESSSKPSCPVSIGPIMTLINGYYFLSKKYNMGDGGIVILFDDSNHDIYAYTIINTINGEWISEKIDVLKYALQRVYHNNSLSYEEKRTKMDALILDFMGADDRNIGPFWDIGECDYYKVSAKSSGVPFKQCLQESAGYSDIFEQAC